MKLKILLGILLTSSVYSQQIVDGSTIARNADKVIGLPYIWGGQNLNKGVDCSGLVKSIYKKYGFLLPRTAKNQAQNKNSTMIRDLSKCKIGDALYFMNDKKHIHHVAIISDYDSDGRPIITHAKGKNFGVVKERMNDKYLSEFIGAKRFYAANNMKTLYSKPLLIKW